MFFRNKKVLVTGAGGLVGSHVLKALHAQGAQLRATFLHRRPPLLDGVDYCMGADLTHRAICEEVAQGMQYVFHCASSTSGAAAINAMPIIHVTPNVVMNAQMLEAAYLAGVEKYFHPGSPTGYPYTGRDLREEDYFQGDPYDKYFGVGWTKRYSEVLCRLYSEKLPRQMLCVVLRPTNIYGPGDKFDPERSHFLPALIRRAVERENPFVLWGNGEEVRDLIYVEDFVRAVLLAMEKIDRYEPLNLGSGKPCTVKEVLALLLKIEGMEGVRVEFDSTKPTTIPRQLVDCSKAERVLGFKPRISLEEGIRRTIAWYRQQVAR